MRWPNIADLTLQVIRQQYRALCNKQSGGELLIDQSADNVQNPHSEKTGHLSTPCSIPCVEVST
jgi:hypothetical protein